MLHQPVLILQIMLIPERAFSLEVGFMDTGNTRRRLILSSSFSEVKVTPLHCQLPIQQLPRGLWLNVALDLSMLVPSLFSGQSSKTISQLILGPFCRLRRIFTLRELQTVEGELINIPKSIDFLPSIQHVSHIFKITDTNTNSGSSRNPNEYEGSTFVGSNSNTTNSSMPALPNHAADTPHSTQDPQDVSNDVRGDSSASRNKINLKDLPHLAFGSRYTTPTPSTSGRNGSGRNESRRRRTRDPNLSVQGEREVYHSRSISSELVGKSITGTPAKQTSLGRENLLASLSGTKSSNISESVENKVMDHLPFTRKKKNNSDKRVLGSIGGEKLPSGESQILGNINVSQKHPRMLSRSARAIMSSDEKVLSREKCTSTNNTSASLNSFSANTSRDNRADSMGASAPSNMMGSLPRTRRSIKHHIRQSSTETRPGSEQGDVIRMKQSARTFQRGKYDKSRYSDSHVNTSIKKSGEGITPCLESGLSSEKGESKENKANDFSSKAKLGNLDKMNLDNNAFQVDRESIHTCLLKPSSSVADSKFEFHSSPRALTSSRTLEPLKLKENHGQREAESKQSSSTNDFSKGNGEVLQWAKKMNKIREMSQNESKDVHSVDGHPLHGNGEVSSYDLNTAASAVSHPQSRSDRDPELVKNEVSYGSRSSSILRKENDAEDLTQSTLIKDNEYPQKVEDVASRPHLETDEKKKMVSFQDAFLSSASANQSEVGYDYDINERFVYGALDFTSNFNAYVLLQH